MQPLTEQAHRPDRGAEIDDRETIVVGATIAALVLAAVYSVSRIGFASHTPDVLRATGLSLFFVATPYWFWRALRRDAGGIGWLRTQSFLTLAAIAATVVLAIVAGPYSGIAGTTLSTIGALAAVPVVASWFRGGTPRARWLFPLGTGLFSGWAAGVVWGTRYKMPVYWEVVSTSADVHHDPLYLTAIGNMLRTYGVASTGLDGVPPIRYHYGSQWLFSYWSDLLQTDLVSFYNLGYAVVTIPLFLASIALFATAARESSLLARPVGWLRSNKWAWIAFLIATIGIIPASGLFAMAVWNAHVLLSESYLAGLVVFMMVLATLVVAVRDRSGLPPILLVFLPLSLAALGFLKISLMVLLFVVLVYACVRLGAVKRPIVGMSLLLMAAVFVVTYRFVALPAQNEGLSPLSFMLQSSAHGWHQFFPLVHFAWTWVYVAARAWEEGITDVRTAGAAFRSRQLIDVELLLVIAIAGFLPGQIVAITGGSAIYFSDVQRWVAVALVIARADHWAALWHERRGVALKPVGSLRLAPVFAGFVALPFVITMALNSVWPLRTVFERNIKLRTAIVSSAGRDVPTGGDRRSLFDQSVLQQGLARSQFHDLVQNLRYIERIPRSAKAGMVIFLPQSYERFWKMWDRDDRCSFAGLMIPAITEVALIDGMPHSACPVSEQYNMDVYQSRQALLEESDITDLSLCAKVQARGFSRVLRLEPLASGGLGRRIIDCRPPVASPPA